MDWYLVHTRRGYEQAAAHRLEQGLHLEVYVAEIVRCLHGSRRQAALFPGYLFLSASGGRAVVESIDHMPGCGRLVRQRCDDSIIQGAPAVLPGATVEQLRQRLAAINTAGGLPAHLTGQPARGTGGAMA